MCVHVFGNSPSPAIASYGLRKSDVEVKRFVNKDFYVDDALTSLPTAQQAASLMRGTQADLHKNCLNLHKIVSIIRRSSVILPSRRSCQRPERPRPEY